MQRRAISEAEGQAVGMRRRGVLRSAAGLLPLVLAGCGFRPIYGPGGGPGSADPGVAEELAAIRVPVIPERFGQLVRRGLQQRLTTAGGAQPRAAKWDLVVSPGLAAEGLGIQPDGAATRVRMIATANWTLMRLTPRETMANGFERAIDAYNIQPSQYFAADNSRDAMERRLAELLANEVVQRVAINFRGLQHGVAPRLIAPVPTPAAPADPSLTRPPGAIVPGRSPAAEGGLSGGIGATGIGR